MVSLTFGFQKDFYVFLKKRITIYNEFETRFIGEGSLIFEL